MLGADLALVVTRFGQYEFTIRRLHISNPEFRAICEDYAVATRALVFWEEDPVRAADYRLLMDELETELLQFFEFEGLQIAVSGGS